jgi:hypothetical protein
MKCGQVDVRLGWVSVSLATSCWKLATSCWMANSINRQELHNICTHRETSRYPTNKPKYATSTLNQSSTT